MIYIYVKYRYFDALAIWVALGKVNFVTYFAVFETK